LRVFFPTDNALYSGMNFATKDRLGLNLLTVKSDRVQLPIIKGHNFDYFEITRKLK